MDNTQESAESSKIIFSRSPNELANNESFSEPSELGNRDYTPVHRFQSEEKMIDYINIRDEEAKYKTGQAAASTSHDWKQYVAARNGLGEDPTIR